MTTFASDIGGQTLVTDLVHELSSGLEIPFLLSGSSSSDFETDGKSNELLFDKEKYDYRYNDVFYEKQENDLWLDQDLLYSPTSVKTELELISETDDFQLNVDKSDLLTTYLKTDSSGHGSGSDTSSTELWTVKSERDTSPVTPPKERTSPENVILFSNDGMHFIPISQEGARKNKQLFDSSSNGTIRIQPKPNSSTFETMDNQHFIDHTVMCNVFKDVQKSFLNNKNGSSKDIKNTVLSRKDSEILQAKRKQERMIRNRESAYLSRKRKKEYVANLEKQVQLLVNENNQLREENQNLKERLMKYEDSELFNSSNKSRNKFIDSPRRTTALFALMITVFLNIGSFSNFMGDRTGGQNGNVFLSNSTVPFHLQNPRHTRSLLWASPEFEDLNTLANLSKTSCPINQTESIRLESELRRWIGGDDDFSWPMKRNISNLEDLPSNEVTRRKSKSKRKNRIRKTHSPSDMEVDLFRMKQHFFNFDTFFEAINRRDDTFYLVSFSADHLLLPALAHNKTSRPKMSLMLPAFLSNATTGVPSDQVEIMQIDCEVTNTQLLSVNESDIPSHMRPYSNSTSKQKSSNVEDASQFSEFLMDETGIKKNSDESIRNSSTREIKNYTFSKESAPLNGGTVHELDIKHKGSKADIYRFAGFPSDVHLNDIIKVKGEKYKSKNAPGGYFFDEKSRRGSNGSNNDGVDGVHFLDPNSRGFLKTLMVPPTLSPAKNLEYGRKPYVKNFKGAMKFLFP